MWQRGGDIKEREEAKFKPKDHLLYLIALLKIVESIDTRDLHNVIFIAQELSWIPNEYNFGYCYADFPAPYSSHLSFDLGILQYRQLVTNREFDEPIRLTNEGRGLVAERILKDIKSRNIKSLASLDSDTLAGIAAYLKIVKAVQYDLAKAFEKAKYFFEEDTAREIEKITKKLKG